MAARSVVLLFCALALSSCAARPAARDGATVPMGATTRELREAFGPPLRYDFRAGSHAWVYRARPDGSVITGGISAVLHRGTELLVEFRDGRVSRTRLIAPEPARDEDQARNEAGARPRFPAWRMNENGERELYYPDPEDLGR